MGEPVLSSLEAFGKWARKGPGGSRILVAEGEIGSNGLILARK
jgi:hypothetical protein